MCILRKMSAALLAVLTVCMVVLLFPGMPGGSTYANANDFSWSLSEDGVLTITGVGDMPFWSSTRQCEWYSRRSEIYRVIIENGITSIGDYAFSECTNLRIIDIPNTVTKIGNSAFNSCKALTSIDIPSSVKSIGRRAFSNVGCTELVIPNSVTQLGDGVFADTASLKKVVLPSEISEITANSFSECSNLTDIEIPETVETISYYAFTGCKGLTGIVFPDGLKLISYNAFDGCTGLRNIEIPESVMEIKEYAFQGCTALESMKISNQDTVVGAMAFADCISLRAIDAPEDIEIANNAFLNDIALVGAPFKFLLSEGLEQGAKTGGKITWNLYSDGILSLTGNTEMKEYKSSDVKGWDQYADFVKKIIIYEGIGSVGAYAFSSMKNVGGVILPFTTTKIGDNAFFCCENLERINFPGNLKAIGNYAFAGCGDLSEIDFPANIESIGNYAFADCDDIYDISLSSSIKSIGTYAFNGCDSLQKIVYCGTPEGWAEVDCGIQENEAFEYFLQCHNYSNGDFCSHCFAEDSHADTDFTGYSVSLDGTICMNLFFSVEDEILADEDASIRLIMQDKEPQRIRIATAEKEVIENEEYYVVGCRVPAKDMHKEIIAQIVLGGNIVLKSRSFSVAEYAEALMQDDNYQYREFAEAFLNYGRYAETYFSGETGNPKDYGADDEQRILSEMSVPSSVPDEEDYIGSSLLLEESTVLRHYYSNNAQGRTKKAITTSEGTRDAYYIEKKFVPNAFDETFGNCDFSVYDYIYKVLGNKDANKALKNLCIALYEYSVACTALQ